MAILVLAPVIAHAGHLHHERHYQEQWCQGQTEYVLPDGTRCDCVTATHAIEVDFAEKWYEALGQALYYAFQTGLRAGIGLIIESDDDLTYSLRLQSVIVHYGLPVDVWEIRPE